MSTPSPLENIFFAALEKGSPSERAAFLDEACGNDSILRDRVERMLTAQVEAGSFLEVPVQEMSPTIDLPVTEQPGDTIGPYKLLEQIGEGGFGVVFMAEQTKPVRREVALKVVKAGMDTKEVVTRFEAERQALAMMDHPNIAKVLGGGGTESGRPYFVMELVPGIPINEYCDQCKLTTRERLGMFCSVCRAVQHAHQKGVIHRDLKPSNVLIAMQDGVPTPKIIDFGVAKAISQRLTEHTLKTRFAQIIGTPLYMSPEQAELNPLGVDTRSDIYSLGVLLYEMLTGTTPFDKDRLHSASLDELRQIIREEEPPRPSTRLSTLTADLATTIADCHRTDARQLQQTVRGDLDWIVMKSMEKDRTRRYESASSLARDVERYLHDEPVEACPPSAAYRICKFVRRNMASIVTLAIVAAALLAGTGVATWQAIRATAERNRALHAEMVASEEAKKAAQEAAISKAVLDFLNNDLLAQADPYVLSGKDVTLREVVDLASQNIEGRFEDQPLVRAEIHYTLGVIYRNLSEYEKAEPHSRLALEIRQQALGEEDQATLESMTLLADVLYRLKRYAESQALDRRMLAISERALGPDNEFSGYAHNQIAMALQRQGRMGEARTHYRQSIEISERRDGVKPINTYANLGIATDDREESIRILREALDMAKAKYGEDHVHLVGSMYWLAVKLGPESEEGAELNRKVLEICQRDLGPDNPYTVYSLVYEQWLAGEEARREGDYDRASEKYTEAISLLPPDGWWVPPGRDVLHKKLGGAYAANGEWNKAIDDYSNILADSPQSLRWVSGLRGRAYSALGNWQKAIDDFSITLRERPDDPIAWLQLAPLYILSGDEDACRQHCRQGLERFRASKGATDDMLAVEVVCKACLLIPDVVNVEELPVGAFDRLLEDNDAPDELLPWSWADRALVAYRAGDSEAAVKFVANSQALDPLKFAEAMNLAVLAMAKHQLQQPADAQQALNEAAELIDRLQRSKENVGNFDLQIARILYSEADALIHGNQQPETGESVPSASTSATSN